MTAAATEHWLCCDVIVDVTDDEWRHVAPALWRQSVEVSFARSLTSLSSPTTALISHYFPARYATSSSQWLEQSNAMSSYRYSSYTAVFPPDDLSVLQLSAYIILGRCIA